MALEIIGMEGFGDMVSTNPLLNPLNLDVDEELRAKGILPFLNYTGHRAPKTTLTLGSGRKSFGYRTLFNEVAATTGLPIGPGSGAEPIEVLVPIRGDTYVDGFNQIVSFRALLQYTKKHCVTFDDGATFVDVDMTPLVAFQYMSTDNPDVPIGGADVPVVLYGVSGISGGGLILGQERNLQLTRPDLPFSNLWETSAGSGSFYPGFAVYATSLSPFGSSGLSRWISLHVQNDAPGSGTWSAGNVSFFDNTSVGILHQNGIGRSVSQGGCLNIGVYSMAGLNSVRTSAFRSGDFPTNPTPAQYADGDSDFLTGAAISDICHWRLEDTEPPQSAPNSYVTSMAPNAVVSNTGTAFGTLPTTEGLSSFDGDNNGVALLGSQEVTLDMTSPALENGQVFGVELTTLMSAPNGSFTVDSSVIVPGDTPSELLVTSTVPDPAFRNYKNIFRERANGDRFDQASLNALRVKVQGVG